MRKCSAFHVKKSRGPINKNSKKKTKNKLNAAQTNMCAAYMELTDSDFNETCWLEYFFPTCPCRHPWMCMRAMEQKAFCYWADGWRLKSFSSGSGEVEIADTWVMTALQKAISSVVAGRSWLWCTTLCSPLTLPGRDPVVTCKERKVQSIVTLYADECLRNALRDTSTPVAETYQSALLVCVADQRNNHTM